MQANEGPYIVGDGRGLLPATFQSFIVDPEHHKPHQLHEQEEKDLPLFKNIHVLIVKPTKPGTWYELESVWENTKIPDGDLRKSLALQHQLSEDIVEVRESDYTYCRILLI